MNWDALLLATGALNNDGRNSSYADENEKQRETKHLIYEINRALKRVLVENDDTPNEELRCTLEKLYSKVASFNSEYLVDYEGKDLYYATLTIMEGKLRELAFAMIDQYEAALNGDELSFAERFDLYEKLIQWEEPEYPNLSPAPESDTIREKRNSLISRLRASWNQEELRWIEYHKIVEDIRKCAAKITPGGKDLFFYCRIAELLERYDQFQEKYPEITIGGIDFPEPEVAPLLEFLQRNRNNALVGKYLFLAAEEDGKIPEDRLKLLLQYQKSLDIYEKHSLKHCYFLKKIPGYPQLDGFWVNNRALLNAMRALAGNNDPIKNQMIEELTFCYFPKPPENTELRPAPPPPEPAPVPPRKTGHINLKKKESAVLPKKTMPPEAKQAELPVPPVKNGSAQPEKAESPMPVPVPPTFGKSAIVAFLLAVFLPGSQEIYWGKRWFGIFLLSSELLSFGLVIPLVGAYSVLSTASRINDFKQGRSYSVWVKSWYYITFILSFLVYGGLSLLIITALILQFFGLMPKQ